MTSAQSPQTTPNGQDAAPAAHADRDQPRHSADAAQRRRRPRGPITLLLNLLSSIWLGVTLLAILFIYSSIGSAGILYPTGDGWVHAQFRQWRGLEMTEFEWFHWWPFDLMIALICINLVVATLRRIPPDSLNPP